MPTTTVFPDFLDSLMTVAGTAWLRLDGTGRLVCASEAAARLLGYSGPSDMQVAQQGGLRPVPDWDQFIKAAHAPASSPVVRRRLSTLRHADGHVLNVWLSAIAADHGCFDVLIISCEEFNDTRKALDDAVRRYRMVLEQSQNGVFITTAERLVFVNTALAEMLAYDATEMVGMPCQALTHEGDRDIVESTYQILLSGEAATSELTVRAWMKDRIGIRDLSVRASRVWYDDQWCLLGTVYDITDLRRGEAALRDYARRLRLLSQQVIEIQERERRRLARELHDEIGQQLTLVKLSLQALRSDCPEQARLQDALVSVNILVEQVRSLSLDLRPSMLDDLGLAPTLRWYATRAAKVAGLHLDSRIDPGFPRLQPEAETMFFRIAQEAITNTLRHSGARRLELELSAASDVIELIIADDGRGFDPATASEAVLRGSSSGLLGMQERAALGGAVLQLESAPGKGTMLHLIMPKACAIPRVLSA